MNQQSGDDPGQTQPPRKRRGRPAGSRNEKTILKELLRKPLAVKKQGKQIEAYTLDLLFDVLRYKVASGDLRAIRVHERISTLLEPPAPEECGIMLAPKVASEGEWEQLMAVERAKNSTGFAALATSGNAPENSLLARKLRWWR